MKDKVVYEMLESLRSTPLSQGDSFEVAVLILAWAKVSNAKSISEEFRLTSALLSDPSRALNALARFAEEGTREFRILGEVKRITSLDPVVLLPTLDLALRLNDAGLIHSLDPTDICCVDPVSSLMGRVLPPAVATLMVELANIRPGDSVYVPWDQSGQLAGRAAQRRAIAYLETPQSSIVPSLVSLLAEKPFEVHHADPIRSPSAVEGGKPRRFDISIAFPPLGQRYDSDVAKRDWFGRFPEATASGAILAVRHLLSQTHRRVVVAIANSLLFSSGAELALREDLIKRGIIEAVIAMPSGLFLTNNVSFAVLILDPAGGHNQIKFINADAPRFREAISKAKCHLINLKSLEELATNDSASDDAAIVPNIDVFAQDAQLQVNRYVVPIASRRLRSLMEKAQTVSLGDVTKTVRPMPTTAEKENAVEALEVGASELPSLGYISMPGRTVSIARQVAEKNVEQFLRPLDVVLIIKGSVGKVGIVPQNVPPPGPGGWVAGQSAIVLRAKTSTIDPRALALQLRSPLGQELLSGIVSGATIPLIPLRELTRMQILVPDLETARRVSEALEKESRIELDIDRLRRAQAEVASDLWTL